MGRIKDYEEEGTNVLTLCIATLVVVAVIFSVIMMMATKARADNEFGYSSELVCTAIFKAEGGMKAKYLYGIRSVHYKNGAEAHKICLNTVNHAYRDWLVADTSDDFILFLSRRYCPINCDNDRGDNKYWVKNVEFFLRGF